MIYERLEKAEPAAVAGVVTGLGGFLALLGADFSALHSAGLAFGLSATQALLTRPAVYSPRSIAALEAGSDITARLPEVLRTGAGFRHPHEPAATIGVFTALAGFLVQTFTGVDFLTAFASAAGLAAVQTAATRARVSSPVTAQRAVAARLYTEQPPPQRNFATTI